ncbi:hypothetical protein HKX48_001095 [Thoreauomyces humboldtii]|nr:hypothetical protein HKX48_001095 [Thoreauomyces humboldtii]
MASCIVSRQILLLLTVACVVALLPSAAAEGLLYLQSAKYGIGTMPFTSITAIGLENNSLFAIGPAKASKAANTTATASDQVWSILTNQTDAFMWSWIAPSDVNSTSPTTTYTAIGVKHRQLQTPENLMFLARTGAIDVLAFWWLSPEKTPALPMRTITFGNGTAAGPTGAVSILSGLDAAGGIYAVDQGALWWIPVVQPLTAVAPSASTVPAKVAEMGGTIQALWSMETTQTVYVAEWFNSSNNIHAFQVDQKVLQGSPTATPLIAINASAYPAPPSDHPVVSSVVGHPTTGDVYVGMASSGGVLVYDRQGKLRAQITTTFVNVLAMEMDSDGASLYIAGDDGAGTGHLDSLDLKGLGLQTTSVATLQSSGAVKGSGAGALVRLVAVAVGVAIAGHWVLG